VADKSTALDSLSQCIMHRSFLFFSVFLRIRITVFRLVSWRFFFLLLIKNAHYQESGSTVEGRCVNAAARCSSAIGTVFGWLSFAIEAVC
jgi:hypothetical protein